MNVLKKAWQWLCGAVKDILSSVCEAVLDRAKEIAKDRGLVSMALEAVKAAAIEGLTGEKAWVRARDIFTAALKSDGRDLGDCAIDTALQLTYDAWKNKRK